MYQKNTASPVDRCRMTIQPTIGLSPGMFARFLIVDLKQE
jgi:hypothetical protein